MIDGYQSYLLKRFALPFFKEVFKGINFIIYYSDKTSATNNLRYNNKGMISIN